ncbi:MAG: hydroxysqualene dehydroxylase HpnE [Nitrospirota bacterium]|nr:hydroxysqualene dehydroxylase HpnE [Nitrospirota bacterium]
MSASRGRGGEAVHVIGAGFAGAACALRLADAGEQVVVWEAGAAPGGRAISRRDRKNGEELDNGPHLFMACYTHVLRVLERLGTDRHLAFQERLHIPLLDAGRRLALSCPPLPHPLHLVAGLLGLGGVGTWGKIALLQAGDRLKGVEPRPDESVADYLNRIGAPLASQRILWDPLCRAVSNLALNEAAAGPFVAALRIALLQGPQAARLGWSRVGLGELLRPLEKTVAATGGSWRRERARGLSVDGGGQISGVVDAGGRTHAARRVVIATDPWGAAPLLASTGVLEAGQMAERVAGCGKSPIVSVYLWLDRQALTLDPLAPFIGFTAGGPDSGVGSAADSGVAGGVAEWVFDRDRLEGVTPGGGQRLVTITSAADALMALSHERAVAAVWEHLTAQLPELSRARLVQARVVKEGRSTPRLTPGVFRPRPGAVPGVTGLFVCGDLTDTGLPATMEAAALSGFLAAGAVLGAADGQAADGQKVGGNGGR